jgi:acyl-CoA thioesterase-1
MSLRPLLAALLLTSAAALMAFDRTASAMQVGGAPAVPIVVALGDSLTAGPGLSRDETYTAILQRKARAAGYPHRFVNRGVSGDTSGGGLRRFRAGIDPQTTALIVALGANDGLRGMPVDALRSNLAAILDGAQHLGVKVLLCGMETPPSHGWNYTSSFHTVFPALAERYGVAFMPFLLDGVFGRPELNLPDGIHPNAAGHRVIAERMWPYLEPLLE